MPEPALPPEERPENRPSPRRAGVLLPAAGPVALDTLVAYASEVFIELARTRDVKSDEAGCPLVRLRSAGMTAECTFQLFEVDFSAIGMATDMPLVAHAYADSANIAWHFGPTPIAETPRTVSPKAAAAALNMDILLEGFRRFVLADSVLFPTSLTEEAGQGRGPLPIDPAECTCSECGGSLEILEVDDATMSVECESGHVYELEHDAFDSAFDYVLEFLSRQRRV